MLCSLIGIDMGRFRDRIHMPVASINIVEMALHGPLVHTIGDRAYLREHLRGRRIPSVHPQTASLGPERCFRSFEILDHAKA